MTAGTALTERGSRKGARFFPEYRHLRDRQPRIGQLDHLPAQAILDLLPQLPIWPGAGQG